MTFLPTSSKGFCFPGIRRYLYITFTNLELMVLEIFEMFKKILEKLHWSSRKIHSIKNEVFYWGFTQEILHGKLHFFVEWLKSLKITHKISNRSSYSQVFYRMSVLTDFWQSSQETCDKIVRKKNLNVCAHFTILLNLVREDSFQNNFGRLFLKKRLLQL